LPPPHRRCRPSGGEGPEGCASEGLGTRSAALCREESADNSGVAFVQGQAQRGGAVKALCVDLRHRRKEGLHGGEVALLRSPMQGGRP